jgi:hypothetical protein
MNEMLRVFVISVAVRGEEWGRDAGGCWAISILIAIGMGAMLVAFQ